MFSIESVNVDMVEITFTDVSRNLDRPVEPILLETTLKNSMTWSEKEQLTMKLKRYNAC